MKRFPINEIPIFTNDFGIFKNTAHEVLYYWYAKADDPTPLVIVLMGSLILGVVVANVLKCISIVYSGYSFKDGKYKKAICFSVLSWIAHSPIGYYFFWFIFATIGYTYLLLKAMIGGI